MSLYTIISKMRNTNLSIIPLIGGDDPQRGKTPAVRWQKYTQCLPSDEDLALWFEKRGLSAYGIVCGSISKLVVLDLDDADVALAFAQRFPDLMKTLVVRSGIRGTPHIYWHVDFPVSSRKVLGGDLKAEGGYVVGPGSKIAGSAWEVVEDAPIRIVSDNEFQTAFAYLTEPQSPANFNEPTASQITPVGAEALYWSIVTRTGRRNEALFKTTCRLRDEGWRIEGVSDALVDIHVQAAALDQRPESTAARYSEAIATIRSAYSRPARLPGQGRLSRLPGSLREALLKHPHGTAILRVIEALHLAGMRGGELFTEREALERLRAIGVGRHSLLRALPIFVPLEPQVNTDDKETIYLNKAQTTEQKKCFFVSLTEPDKNRVTSQSSLQNSSQQVRNNRSRPPRRYLFPDVATLCRRFGVKPTGGDAIQIADVRSVKAYRQALERTFIQRKPGEHFMAGLAARLHLSVRTIQRYHRALEISCVPTFEDHRINRQNFRDLLMTHADCARYQVSQWGHFLEDETGKRYPPYREIAAKLLRQKHTVFYRKQRANAYWIGEKPATFGSQATAVSGQQNRMLPVGAHSRVPNAARKGKDIPNNRPHGNGSFAMQGGQSRGLPPQTPEPLVFRDGKMFADTESPDMARCVPPGQKSPKSRESKRKYRQEMADSAVEGLAKSVHKVVNELAPSERAMSLANARRLVETYGTQAVAHTLNKLIWMAGKGKIQNPAGFMIVASRQQWRVDHNATGLGDPAPQFKGEPVRKPRSRPRSKTDAVHKSERWLTNRIAFEVGQGNFEQVEYWEAKLDDVVKSRTQRWYRWRVHFARENENPESVKFWQGFLNRKMGVDEF